jgi:hypothetical protein
MTADREGTRVALVVFVLAALAQAWIALNPGYFSHDELQWGVRSDVDRLAGLPWMGWFDVGQFQWRPLTFNLWLPLSWMLFGSPVAWHGLWVLAGSAIAAVLARLLLRLAVGPRVAAVAALVFALGPYAVYVHGWVATLAELLVIAIGLALAHRLLSLRAPPAAASADGAPAGPMWRAAAPAAIATALALMAKESALAFAPLLALCWLLWPRERVLSGAALGSAAVVAVYLALRLSVLQSGSAEYALDPALAPRHWAAYHLFVLRPSTFEVPGLWRASTGALALAAAFWLVLYAVLARANRRIALAALGGGTILLAPVLPIAISANQYGYGFSLWLVACIALGWAGFGRPAKVFVALFALIVVWHGANVQRQMRVAGERQAVFQPALAAALAGRAGELRLYADESDAWFYRRITTGVESWHRAPIGDRVRWVGSTDQAHAAVQDDGSLRPTVE